MPQHPSGPWIVYREESYWVSAHATKQGCFAEADLWQELLEKMVEAERTWDQTMSGRTS
jgi:hypothetical protein